jgi:hypothetical protein
MIGGLSAASPSVAIAKLPDSSDLALLVFQEEEGVGNLAYLFGDATQGPFRWKGNPIVYDVGVNPKIAMAPYPPTPTDIPGGISGLEVHQAGTGVSALWENSFVIR